MLDAGRGTGRVATELARRGYRVVGVDLDAAHLPLPSAPFGLDAYDAWRTAAGLELVDRAATWDGEPCTGGGYAVTVHRRRAHAR